MVPIVAADKEVPMPKADPEPAERLTTEQITKMQQRKDELDSLVEKACEDEDFELAD